MSAVFSNEVIADVTGTVSVTGPVTVVQPTGSSLHTTTDAGSVTTVDNAAGAAAVNIQDGGNSITVDGNTNPNGLTDTQLRASPVPVSGSLTITPATAATATVTRVTVSTTVATLKAANAARLQLIVHNEAGILFVKLGAAATATDYSFRLTANTILTVDEYTGIVTAIKSSGTSEAQVTEL